MAETFTVTAADIVRAGAQRRAFDQGRALAISRASAALAGRTALIRAELDRDLVAGLPPHGRACRIARRLLLNPLCRPKCALHTHRRTVARIVESLMSLANS
jgi:hypothetical protein